MAKKLLLQVSIIPQTQNCCIKTQNHRGIDFLENKNAKNEVCVIIGSHDSDHVDLFHTPQLTNLLLLIFLLFSGMLFFSLLFFLFLLFLLFHLLPLLGFLSREKNEWTYNLDLNSPLNHKDHSVCRLV